MPTRVSKTGSELSIVDNSDTEWKVMKYLSEWCQLSKSMDIATGYFEIGAFLSRNDEWHKVDEFRILMGGERRRENAYSAKIRLPGTLISREDGLDATISSPLAMVSSAEMLGTTVCVLSKPSIFSLNLCSFIFFRSASVIGI